MITHHSLKLSHGRLMITARLCSHARLVRNESLAIGSEQVVQVVSETTNRRRASKELGRWSGGHLTEGGRLGESRCGSLNGNRNLVVCLSSYGAVDITLIGGADHALRRGETQKVASRT
jgi:hypothetical protein